MRFRQIFLLSVTAALVSADIHWNGICVDYKDDQAVYNAAATESACAAYKAWNGGSKQWQSCPDCVMTGTGLAYCYSAGKRIGGVEITNFCKTAGAANALTK